MMNDWKFTQKHEPALVFTEFQSIFALCDRKKKQIAGILSAQRYSIDKNDLISFISGNSQHDLHVEFLLDFRQVVTLFG